ncbi:YfcC family protein [Desemzia sp. RIT804]|uniref:YfcC family protein n=1 Tax=Desemzia sp. RIT 804 TaxID=2810209 RepID=UPI00194F058E|nr:Na+/H+ antiporter NhaC family protein [Desemzia sp. RIT 804]MBM6613787.1 YfcC family protein [Desemzia sp. RIT 804]
MEKQRRSRIPHTFVTLIAFTIVMAILTYILPAGQFERTEVGGRTVVIPNSYTIVESNPQGLFDVLKSIPIGMAETADIIFFLFIVGGAFQLITDSGMISSGISLLVQKLKGKEKWVIPILILVFGILGSTMGLSEETIVFIPIGVALALALGYDALVGLGMISLGAAIGFFAGFMNPFSVGVAQEIAELPLFSGVGFRVIILAVLWIVTSVYVMRYAEKVKKNPENSLLYNHKKGTHVTEGAIDFDDLPPFTKRHLATLVVFIGGFAVIAYGVFQYGWFIVEIGSVFLGMGILTGFISRMRPSEIAESFVIGAKEMVFAGLVVGVARSILVVMENGLIIDTLINNLSSLISSLPDSLAVVGMYVTQIVVNFFIPSGSGQAAATMPVMIPLADTLGITRQTAVLAFQFGDGFMDSIIPTSGVLMAQLSIAKVSYDTWLKFLGKLMLIWLVIGLVFLLIANAIQYGPF